MKNSCLIVANCVVTGNLCCCQVLENTFWLEEKKLE